MGYTLLDTPQPGEHKIRENSPSMEMRFFESYGSGPSIDWRDGTGSRKRSLDRCGHARLILFSRHEADPLAMQLESPISGHIPFCRCSNYLG